MATPFELPALPYADTALDPVISANTLSFHYGKHHKTYVDNLNKFAEGTKFADMDLEGVIKESWADKNMAIFNNSAQVWNHTFYWNSLSANGGAPSGKLAEMIDSDLGGLDKFKADFAAAGNTQFGSGWAWLVYRDGKLAIEKTPNAETPLATGGSALLTIDVWEHAYYLDWQNRRPAYTEAVVEKLLNWNFAAENLAKAA